jgi:3-hydroxybutyryl-CoA dehydrogenase
MEGPLAVADSTAVHGTIAVVGAGTMGSGIAQVCAAAGFEARLTDRDETALERGRVRAVDGMDRLLAKGRLDTDTHAFAVARLSIHVDLAAAVDGADIVIEAASEDLAVKQAIFAALDAATSADVVLATNTSSLSVAACAAATSRPERVIGLHFFNPAPLMALVEVAPTDRTNRAVEEQALAFVEAIGKTAVHCEDSPGFIVNRVGRPYVIEAVRLVEAGEAGVVTIDAALEDAGYPMGPFRLIDLIGLDVDQAINVALHDGLGDAERFLPPALEHTLIAAGRSGRKVSHGFYRYARGSEPELDDDDLPPVPAGGLDGPAIVERLEMAMINEAYRAVGEGISSTSDVDTAMRLGAGHPRGPFERVDDLGLRHIVERLHALRAATGPASDEQYEIAPMLWTVATV